MDNGYTQTDLAADLDALFDGGFLELDFSLVAATGDPRDVRYALTDEGKRAMESWDREAELRTAMSARQLQEERHAATRTGRHLRLA